MKKYNNRRFYEKNRNLDRYNLEANFRQDMFDALYPVVEKYKKLIYSKSSDFLWSQLDIVNYQLEDTLEDELDFYS